MLKTNDLKKGTRVLLNNGWEATICDNMKGNTRCCDVEGDFREMGSVYSHDMKMWMNALGDWEPIEHTEKQLTLKKQLQAMGW